MGCAASLDGKETPKGLVEVLPPSGPAAGQTNGAPQPVSAFSKDGLVAATYQAQLQKVLTEHPYLEVGKAAQPHPLTRWVVLCREALVQGKYEVAQEHLRRVQLGLRAEARPIAEAFNRFDTDGSGQLDATEFRHMCAYLGWGHEEADLMDLDGDGKVSLAEFQAFVGHFGGIQQLFEQRRLRVTTSRKDVCDFAGLVVGARVRAHFYIRGQKSKTWQEAVVLAVGVERKSADGLGPTTLGVQLEFGFGVKGGKRWRARQVIPPSWVVSGVEEASVAMALREVGILDEQQAYWSLLLPDSELRALERLESCQRTALSLVRNQATEHHEQAMPSLREHFKRLGYGEMELQAVLGWVQDLAPIVVHVGLDRMGHFLETDEYYRSQFETKTSQGAGDGDMSNATRRRWEHDLFFGAYDDAKPFDRCKYGALNVMNDYRGVVTARQYGDSYLVLKDVRLRCTFASEDSGGIEGSRLAVLDKYAHVLDEYEDEELRGLVEIATSAIAPQPRALSAAAAAVQLLRGRSEDPTAEWITQGFPKLAQASGRYYFEVQLFQGCGAPQVGVLNTRFKLTPYAFNQEGVGDDANGWSVDGINAAIWHGGKSKPWGQLLPSKEVQVEIQGQYWWQKTYANEKLLENEATVGVAVDMDKRQVWFTCNGTWTEAPAFGPEDIPYGTEVYPALSLKGRAAFHFGANRKYAPPPIGGAPFQRWPGATLDLVRVDCPALGDEEKLNCYKEVQIHGEVSLKRNVQRLVAASKYREKPKTERSMSFRVVGSGSCDGLYRRVGSHCGAPLYRGEDGGSIYYDDKANAWHISPTDDLTTWQFSAPAGEALLGGQSLQAPPRKGWEAPDQDSGLIDAEAFRLEAEEAGVPSAAVARLLQALSATTADGQTVMHRKRGSSTLTSEWAALDSPASGAEAVWHRALQRYLKKLQEDAGFPESKAKVIESEHPYAAKRQTLSFGVAIEGASALNVHFASSCSTADSRNVLRAYTAALSRAAAGPGARVEVVAPGGRGKVWGTVVGRDDDVWRVRLDRGYHITAGQDLRCDNGHRLLCFDSTGSSCSKCSNYCSYGEAVMGCRICSYFLCEACHEDVDQVDDFGVPRWPQIGDTVEGKYMNGSWYGATIADRTILLDWYTVKRTVTYTLDWTDGDPKDREKSLNQIRRPRDSIAAAAEHRDLEELPLFAHTCPPQEDAVVLCRDEPQAVYITYGFLDVEDEVTFTDREGDVSKLMVDTHGLEWTVPGMGARPCVDLRFHKCKAEGDLEKDTYAVIGPFGMAAIVDPPPGTPEQVALMVRLLRMARMCHLEVGGSALEEIRVAAAKAEEEEEEGEEEEEEVQDGEDAGPEAAVIEEDEEGEDGQGQQAEEEGETQVEDALICSEIAEFGLDVTCPFCPIFVKRFAGSGPAQEQGVEEGWFLDLPATVEASGDPFKQLLDGLGGVPASASTWDLLEGAMKNPQDLLQRLNGKLLRSSGMTLVFVDSCSPQQVLLLPEAHVTYSGGQRVSSEVKTFATRASGVHVESFLKIGPAQKAGVRTDWVLDLAATYSKNPELVKLGTQDVAHENPNVLLGAQDVTLVFKQPNVGRSLRCECSENTWKCPELQGDSVDFEFTTDGDPDVPPEKRWGFWAMVLPKGTSAPSKSAVDRLATQWVQAKLRATWVKVPEVQRDDWDEARLRALCARHGWEFEWMTEDGERRRRVKEVARLEVDDALTEAAKNAVRRNRPSTVAPSAGSDVPPEPPPEAKPDGYVEHAPVVEAGGTVEAPDTSASKGRWKAAVGAATHAPRA